MYSCSKSIPDAVYLSIFDEEYEKPFELHGLKRDVSITLNINMEEIAARMVKKI